MQSLKTLKMFSQTMHLLYEMVPLKIKSDLKIVRQKGKKVKGIPLQAWTGPEVSRRLRTQDFKTIGTRRW
jgi:hypothetical protein